MTMRSPWTRWALSLAPIVLTIVTTAVIILLMGENPLEAYANLLSGGFESWAKVADVAIAMVPLMLAAAGMLITFAAFCGAVVGGIVYWAIAGRNAGFGTPWGK